MVDYAYWDGTVLKDAVENGVVVYDIEKSENISDIH